MYANLQEQSEVVDLRMKPGWVGFGIYVGILCLLRCLKHRRVWGTTTPKTKSTPPNSIHINE